MPTIEELNEGFTLGDWEVLPGQGLLKRGDEEHHPEPKVFKVLLALAIRDGNVVSPDELIDEVWEGRAFGNEPIQRCINLLRRHFGDRRPYEYIDTLHRRGYRLLKPVELHREAADEPAVRHASNRPVSTSWKAVAVGIAAALVLLTVVLKLVDIGGRAPVVNSLAIMPIENLSGDPANQYIVEGIKNTLAQRLSELPEFTIKNVKGKYEGEATEVAATLGVESMLYGSVQMRDDALKVVYEIVNGSDAAIMKSGEETGTLDNLFGVQERLAKAVRNELAGARTPELISRVAPDSTAYNSYQRAAYLLEHRFEEDKLEESIRLFRESIDIDESYGPAYLGLATAYALMPDYREMPLDEYLGLAVATIEKGVAMDPRIADLASAIDGFVHYQRKEWAEAEKAYRHAVSAEVVDTNAFSWYSQMMACVGRLHESRDIALQGEFIDPDSTVINSRIAMIYTWLGNTSKADEYFERASDLDAQGLLHDMAYALFLFRTGQIEKSRLMALASVTRESSDTSWINPVFDALVERSPEAAHAALAAINASYESGEIVPHVVILVRAMLGDVEGAMAIARTLDNPGETFSMELLFIDELEPLRRHPDFMPLMDSLGVTDYWRDAGCRWEDDEVRCDT